MTSQIIMLEMAAQSKVSLAQDFTVELTDGVESVGVGLVSSERAQRLLPAPFKLANNGEPVTPLVVLAARCQGMAVNSGEAIRGAFAQIGLMVLPPDSTGELNMFTLWHFTTHLTLVRSLQNMGLASQHVPEMGYSVTLGGKAGSTEITLPAPAQPPFSLAGKMSEPSQPVTFNGNWWAKAGNRLLKMNSVVPAATFSESQLTLTTRANNPLGQLIGGDTLNFAILQRFNIWETVHTTISLLHA
ncbi:MAG: hypothetical protein U0175_18695 [Caldilineaceae bacterium]